MSLLTSKNEDKYKQACQKVRTLRQKMIDNLDSSFNVIDAELDAKIEKDLVRALNMQKKYKPKTQCSKSAMYLGAYA